jgi:hypothetical protein
MKPGPMGAAALLAGAAAMVWTLYWFELRQRQQAVARTEAAGITISGRVEEFAPEPYAGHGHAERFTVNGLIAHGGPIHEGASVRIVAVGESIARLEVCDTPGLGR